MKQVRFKPYLGPALDGTIVLVRCDNFDISDFKAMLNQPRNLVPINFQAAYQIWAETNAELILSGDGEELVRICKLGFVGFIKELGYRVVPRLEEIEVF